MAGNPFKPTAGARPPLLVGREHALDSFREGLDDGPGAPGLLSIITGPRGVGKTVLLSEAEDAAREHGWVTVSETATPGLLQRLIAPLSASLAELGDGPRTRRVTAINTPIGGITTELPAAETPQLRATMQELLTLLAAQGTGLLVTVDEIHAIQRAELNELAAIVQHLIREGLPIALVAAGIPAAVSDLLREQVSTFLRRADPITLDDVPIAQVRAALEITFRESGVTLVEPELSQVAAATGGYPFLIQLVGYHVWRLATEGRATGDTIERGIAAARLRLGATVLQPALQNLSPVDRTFLLAMAADDGPSRVTDIATRLNQSDKYVGVYRKRLISAGMITATSRGSIDIALPHLRQYLREHAATLQRPE